MEMITKRRFAPLIIAVAAFGLFVHSPVAEADSHRGKHKQKGKHLEEMATAVGMTDAQKEQFVGLMKSKKTACRGSDDRKACMKGQKAKIKEELKTFLSEDQLESLKVERQKKRVKRQAKRGERMVKMLDLNDSQKSEFLEIKRAAREACSSVENRKACFMEQKTTVKSKMQTILSSEQMDKFNSIQDKRAEKKSP